MASDAKPCPCCRAAPIEIEGGFVTCSSCSAYAGSLADWNRRTPGPALRLVLESIRAVRAADHQGELVICMQTARALLAEWE